MGLSRLAKACQECPFKDSCENKRMEALAYLPMAAQASNEIGMSASMPLMRETMTIMIQGNPTVVYKDDIQKEIERHLGLYPSLLKELC